MCPDSIHNQEGAVEATLGKYQAAHSGTVVLTGDHSNAQTFRRSKVLWSCPRMWNGTGSSGYVSAPNIQASAIKAIGYKLLNDFVGDVNEWRVFSAQWGVKMILLMRHDCLGHVVSPALLAVTLLLLLP